MSYKFIDLFAGIGGFHLGMKSAGAQCVFASEWDEYARKTYYENFYSSEPQLFDNGNFKGDITEVNPHEIPYFDILCGGFPCQPFSNSGLKKGFKDIRGNLFFYIAEILRIKNPASFLLENVRGLLTHDNGNTFDVITHTLTKDLGYSLSFKILKGSDYGVPQLRPRLYMVGFKNKQLKFDFPPPIPLKLTMSDIFKAPCTRDVGFTIRVGGRGFGINDWRNWDCYMVDGLEVKLTYKEAMLMNGFADNFKFPVSPHKAMRQLGNSVVVPVISSIAKNIMQTLNSQKS